MKIRIALLTKILLCLAPVIAIQTARAADAPNRMAQTEGVTVTAEATGSLTTVSPDESAKQKTQVAGAFTLKTNNDMQLGRASNFEDLLQRTPGVFLQSENGAEVSKISIRGSGITSEDEPLGVMFLMDGLNFNQGDGETTLEDIDVAVISQAEIFRGADAFKYGGLTLGGAINLVPFTGYDAAPFQVRLEGGSYGFFRGDMNGGGVQGKFDEFGAISFREREGFRDHSREDTEIFFSDFGYKFSDHLENRFYLTLDRTNRNLPGGLTKSEMDNDPTQANALAIAQDWNKLLSNIRLADKLSFRTEDIQFDVGAFWFHHDIVNRGFFSPDFREGIEEFYSDNYGGNVNFVSRYEVFGHRNILTIGVNPQYEVEPTQNYENIFGHTGATTARGIGSSINLPAYLEDQLYLTQRFSFVAGAQAIFAERHFKDEFFTDEAGNQSRRQNFWGFNPKVGAIYEISPKTQAFANFSRSWQPPSIDNLVDFDEGPNSSVVYTPLSPQHAWTIEVGTRGEYSRFEWELAYYHSWFRDELLEINDAFGNDIGTRNVPRTIHQGIEADLEIELLRNILVPEESNASGDRLSLDQSYTLNDFHMDQNAVYGNNRLPGIPVHVYAAQLLYENPSGFYAGPNLQCNFSRYPVDEANTLFADSYVLLGFRAGFRRPNGFSVFIDCRNLTNKTYAAAIDVIADARTEPNPEIFHPGDGRSFYGGVSWTW
ncbi:MAG TPA: TonB-dependent receptor [Candidatus Udaeobacter sp.]|nr:TonB-dependent receptor [Candidatus Udaeobacter sp.]